MTTTEKLFYENPELYTCQADVLAVEGSAESPVLVLDCTIFYPEGGGQACDLGTIESSDGKQSVEVVAVSDEAGVVRHFLAGPCPFKARDRLRLFVDRERRTDYSQQHTAEHLIGAIALRLLGAHVVSVHFGADRSYIDFDLPFISDEDLSAVEDEIEAAIAQDYAMRYHICPPEDIASFPLRRKAPEVGDAALRVVEIDGLDYSACCGLHATSTGKLRAVRLFPSEKYKGMTRVYFAAGSRATADYRAVSRIARDAARELGTSEAQLAEVVARELSRRKELEFQLGALEREKAAAEVAATLAALPSAEGGTRVVAKRYNDRAAASLMSTAKAFAEAGAIAILASLPELTVQAVAPSSDARLGERLKSPLATEGGKGGGGPANFRAVFKDEASLERFMEAAEASLRGIRPSVTLD
jgi:alanyl-tRNA synthetase